MPEKRQLVDTSVLLRAHQPAIADRVEAMLLENKLWTCGIVDLEYIYATKAHEVPEALQERLVLPTAPITPATIERALEIMGSLATAGLHRHAKGTDCIIAASAQMAGLSVLHYDHDFDSIAEVTALDTEWVAPPGSLDKPKPGKKDRPT
jgi:hypothetical protein